MVLNSSTHSGILVIQLPTRLDTISAQDAESDLQALLAPAGKDVLFDCSEMGYISSAGIRVLLIVTKNLMKSGRKVAFCSLTPHIREVFEMGGFTRIFSLYDSQNTALKKMT